MTLVVGAFAMLYIGMVFGGVVSGRRWRVLDAFMLTCGMMCAIFVIVEAFGLRP